MSCYVYIDDILIFSKTKDDHRQHVTQVPEQLKAHKLFALPKKWSFYSSKVSFLSFTISLEGIKMEDSKLSTMKDWQYPLNVKELG
jgi:hypothetical protein